ncbi:MAG: hypothetical protein GX569_01180 [Candidatus Riflebacteria bacterium]|nr:hypothetical protein [Candidatus Riflebacteria bacterium]
MRINDILVCCLVSALMVLLASGQIIADNSSAHDRLGSIVVTFDAPIIERCNQSQEFYNLLVTTIKSPTNGIMQQIKNSGALWSVSYSRCGIQFAIYHFDDPGVAVKICKDILTSLKHSLRDNFVKRSSHEFADYIHSLPSQSGLVTAFRHKPVTVDLSENMSAYANELAGADELASFFTQTSTPDSNTNVLPNVQPTVYTVFSWSDNNSAAFFTAKYLGEKFIREAGLEDLLNYEIVFDDAAISLVVYLTGSEEMLAENMAKFRQIDQYRLGREPPTDWLQFSRSLSDIMSDDLRDIAKKALFEAWQKHWHGDFTNLRIDVPVAPGHQTTGICMPAAHQHLVSFSNGVFPNFAATRHENASNTCDITIAIGGNNRKIVDEIRNDLENSAPPVSLTLVSESEMLKIVFHCSADEVSGNLARIRNHIYNNLVEKGLMSEPVDTLKIGIAGVSAMPPFELRGLLQKGWVPTTRPHQTTPLTDHSRLLRIDNASTESLRQRWQLYLASNRGRSELLAMIAAAGHDVKDFVLPR